eukprot:Sspe_Gene.53502::Locus_29561_Transcript_3_3_Confidence_0.500_Length_2530::g.53502::m.53502
MLKTDRRSNPTRTGRMSDIPMVTSSNPSPRSGVGLGADALQWTKISAARLPSSSSLRVGRQSMSASQSGSYTSSGSGDPLGLRCTVSLISVSSCAHCSSLSASSTALLRLPSDASSPSTVFFESSWADVCSSSVLPFDSCVVFRSVFGSVAEEDDAVISEGGSAGGACPPSVTGTGCSQGSSRMAGSSAGLSAFSSFLSGLSSFLSGCLSSLGRTGTVLSWGSACLEPWCFAGALGAGFAPPSFAGEGCTGFGTSSLLGGEAVAFAPPSFLGMGWVVLPRAPPSFLGDGSASPSSLLGDGLAFPFPFGGGVAALCAPSCEGCRALVFSSGSRAGMDAFRLDAHRGRDSGDGVRFFSRGSCFASRDCVMRDATAGGAWSVDFDRALCGGSGGGALSRGGANCKLLFQAKEDSRGCSLEEVFDMNRGAPPPRSSFRAGEEDLSRGTGERLLLGERVEEDEAWRGESDRAGIDTVPGRGLMRSVAPLLQTVATGSRLERGLSSYTSCIWLAFSDTPAGPKAKRGTQAWTTSLTSASSSTVTFSAASGTPSACCIHSFMKSVWGRAGRVAPPPS